MDDTPAPACRVVMARRAKGNDFVHCICPVSGFKMRGERLPKTCVAELVEIEIKEGI